MYSKYYHDCIFVVIWILGHIWFCIKLKSIIFSYRIKYSLRFQHISWHLQCSFKMNIIYFQLIQKSWHHLNQFFNFIWKGNTSLECYVIQMDTLPGVRWYSCKRFPPNQLFYLLEMEVTLNLFYKLLSLAEMIQENNNDVHLYKNMKHLNN